MTTYERRDDLAQVQGPHRVTLLCVREVGSLPVALSGTAVAVWEETASSPFELRSVVSAIATRFRVPESVVEDDVRDLCRELARIGLLVPVDDEQGRSAP